MRSSQRTYGKRRPWGLLLLLCLSVMIFCPFQSPPAGAAELKAELVNKVMEEWDGMGYPTGQVQLTFPDGRTLLLPYRSHLQPVVADGKVHIFVAEGAEIKSIMIYDPAKGQGQSFYPLPDDLDPYYGSPSFSPDGTRVAYYCPLGARQESGFIDRTGKIVIPLQSQWFGRGKFSEGLARVAVKRKHGFIDTTGKMTIPPRFDTAGDFSEGLARVFVRDEAGFIDRTGKIVIEPQYESAFNFSEGLAMVKKGNKYGFIDHTGRIVIPLRYDYADAFSEGLAAVALGKKYGFIDKTGKLVIPAKFDHAYGFREGVAFVSLEDGKGGLIDKTVRVIIPWPYKNHPSFSQGLARVRVEGKWGFIDTTGKMVIPPQFDGAEDFSEGLAAVHVGERGGFGVRVRSWPDWQLVWESPSYKELDITHPLDPPVWKTSSLLEVDLPFSYPQGPLTFQVLESGKSDKAKPEKSE